MGINDPLQIKKFGLTARDVIDPQDVDYFPLWDLILHHNNSAVLVLCHAFLVMGDARIPGSNQKPI